MSRLKINRHILLLILFLFALMMAVLFSPSGSGRAEDLSPLPLPYNNLPPLPYNNFPHLPKTSEDYEDTKLFIFISSSMPSDIVRQYIEDTEDIKENVVFVLRGFVRDDSNLIETIKYVKRILCEDPEDENTCHDRIVDVNPGLFSLFGVRVVPAFVVVEGGAGVPGCISEEDAPPHFFISYGDAVLSYHLSRMSKAGSKEAEKLLRRLKNSYWD